jgi:hypothetical protein
MKVDSSVAQSKPGLYLMFHLDMNGAGVFDGLDV